MDQPHPLNTRALRQAWKEWVVANRPNLMLKLGSGLGCRPETLRRNATHFFNVVQDELRGRNWAKYDDAEMPIALGFMEHLETNLHMHLAANVPDIQLKLHFMDGARTWRRIRPAGDFHATVIDDPGACASYITKEFRLAGREEAIWMYGRNRDVR